MTETVMPVVKGCVGDRMVNVLRDTGCGGAVIRKELVKEEHMTGTIQRVFWQMEALSKQMSLKLM